MKRGEFNKWAEGLAEQYRLSYQLTAAWLDDHGYNDKAVKPEVLRSSQVAALIKFARV